MNFIALIIIVVIVIILIAPDMATATLLLAALANIGVIMTHANNFKENIANTLLPERFSVGAEVLQGEQFDTNAAAVQDLGADSQNDTIYSTAFANYESYKPDVDMARYASASTVDDNNILVAKHRARDKETIANRVNKDADFYRYHFAGEIDEYEKKDWWGEYED